MTALPPQVEKTGEFSEELEQAFSETQSALDELHALLEVERTLAAALKKLHGAPDEESLLRQHKDVLSAWRLVSRRYAEANQVLLQLMNGH
jgi:hypothetical protein